MFLTLYNNGKVFRGNMDRNSVVKNMFNPPIKARYIRVLVRYWHRWPAMRIELYGCDAGTTTQDDVTTRPTGGTTPPHDVTTRPTEGTTTQDDVTTRPTGGTTPPHDVTTRPTEGTTTQDDVTTRPTDGTTTQDDVTTRPTDGTTTQDDVTTRPTDGTTTQDDVTTRPTEGTTPPHDVTKRPTEGTTTQYDVTTRPTGGTTPPHDVTTRPTEGTTTQDDVTTRPTDGTTTQDDVTTRPTDGTTTQDDVTTRPTDGTTTQDDVTTRPTEGTTPPHNVSTRPSSGCEGPLGMESGNIKDYQITASSHWRPQYVPWNARLHLKSVAGVIGGGWASGSLFPRWIQIDLGAVKKVTAIATQGLQDIHLSEWTQTYQILYGDDPMFLTLYNNGKVFRGNMDRNSVVKNMFNPPIKARYIRVLVRYWHRWPAMRIELYGCDAA
ncbi:hypothetical protein QZH41_014681 [Actinostola sp. cb2023]|nr:hypothetical protein QZH41_014681 [Actinostola sp. cb2023]